MGEYPEQKLKAGEVPSNLTNYEVIEHKIGNQTNADVNANKFFSLELIRCGSDWYCYSNYGRVSEQEYNGVSGLYGPDDESSMRRFFESKFKSKVRPSKGYIEIQFVKAKVGSPKARLKVNKVDEAEIPAEKKQKLAESANKSSKPTIKLDIHPTVQKLVEQWYRESSTAIRNNSAVDITSDGISTPLGVLTFGTIDRGRKILGEIVDAIKNKDDSEVKKLTGAFYSVIPTKLGRKITDDDLLSTDIIVQQKLDLLQMMTDALEVGGATFVSDIEVKYRELSTDIEFLERTDPEWNRIERKIRETRGYNHGGTPTKVRNILRIKIHADRGKFSKCGVSNTNELFHGSRNTNLVGIMKSGMKIAPPEAPRSGLAFGRGAYFADRSTKSLNYSLYPFPGVERSTNCFLFLFSVKCGKQMIVHYGSGNEADVCRNRGYDSVYAKEGQGLYHSEYIIPTVDQCQAEYIVELER